MSEHRFGGAWTEWKLDAVESYFEAYLRITGGKGLTRWYVDAFAGSGSRVDADDPFSPHEQSLLDEVAHTKVHEGSAHRALDYPFDRFLLVEKRSERADELRRLADSHGKGAITRVVAGDGINALREWCVELGGHPKHRGVVFLDPYAMHVEWSTMQELAATGKVDVFILFPVSALLRNLPGDRVAISAAHQAKLDRVFGCDDWSAAFYHKGAVQQDLFAGEQQTIVRLASPSALVSYYQNRLGTIFRGGVADDVRWLVNQHNTPLFALLFAMANEDERAWKPGLRVAKYILSRQR